MRHVRAPVVIEEKMLNTLVGRGDMGKYRSCKKKKVWIVDRMPGLESSSQMRICVFYLLMNPNRKSEAVGFCWRLNPGQKFFHFLFLLLLIQTFITL